MAPAVRHDGFIGGGRGITHGGPFTVADYPLQKHRHDRIG